MNSIAWHKESLKNLTAHWKRERELAEETLARCARAEKAIHHYEKQIVEAEQRGITAFDRDRFLKPKTECQM